MSVLTLLLDAEKAVGGVNVPDAVFGMRWFVQASFCSHSENWSRVIGTKCEAGACSRYCFAAVDLPLIIS